MYKDDQGRKNEKAAQNNVGLWYTITANAEGRIVAVEEQAVRPVNTNTSGGVNQSLSGNAAGGSV